MIDANSQFFAILTNVGMAKQANADALGIAWKITDMGIGDGNPAGVADPANPIPSASQIKLLNEWRRKPLNQLRVDPVNPAVIIAEQIIPADEGGKWIREIGLYDADGDLVAVANCAPSFKPLLSQGSGRTQVVRMNFVVSSTGSITLKIDPAVVLATREFVEQRIMEELYKLDSKQSVRAATTGNVVLSGLQTIDGVALLAGERVLVKNQAAAKDNGIWVAATAAWARAADADSSTEVTSALLVSVEQGATLADTRWQLITDGVIVLGTTPLTFQNVTQGFAPINSPGLVNPTANTPAQFDNSLKISTTEFAQRAQGNFAGRVDIAALPATLSATAAGNRIVLAASGTLTLPLVSSVPTGTNFFLFNTTPGVVNIARQGTDLISAMSVNSMTSVTLQSLSTIQITAGNGQWVVEGGMSALKYAPEFACSSGVTGWVKNPSGLIEQWGQGKTDVNGQVYVSFPLAFTGAGVRNISLLHQGGLPVMSCVVAGSVTNTGCTLRVAQASGGQADWSVQWRVIGF